MRKILIIEDNRSIRESTLELLSLAGFAAVAADNGKQGIQVAQKHLPDLILCDVTMPEMDGYGVLTALRQNPKTAAIPFIFLTGRSTKEEFRQGMELGADDYLTKPYTINELMGAIASQFEKNSILQSHSQRQLEELRSSIALSLPYELRTPLHGIMGLAEVLIEDHARLEQPEVLEIAQGIYQSAARLYQLTQNFLLYAELEITRRDPERIAAFSLHETHYPQVVIANTATQVARLAERSSDLRLNLQNASVRISDLHLKKVIEELTSNAFKFSQPGTAVTLTAVSQGQGLMLEICDRGRGMKPQQIAQLGAYMQFERHFYEQQGSGLGLVIAKRLVELHGGELAIDSDPGQQTTVRVMLPGIS